MNMKIAVFLDSNNKTIPFNKAGVVKVYSKDKEEWNVIKEVEFSIMNLNSSKEIRESVINMVKELGQCKVFVAAGVRGLCFTVLDAMGFSIWKVEGKSIDFLNHIAENELQEKADRLNEADNKTMHTPIEGNEAGKYYIDLKEVLENNGEVTSKQVLLPFFNNTYFNELEIICGHVPPWFNKEFKRLNLNMSIEPIIGNSFKIKVYPLKVNKMTTKYGEIQGIYLMDRHPNGNIRDCVLNKPNLIKTKYGALVPQYEDNDERRKCTISLSFYDDGNLKSISLQEQKEIETPLGSIKAEYMTFYKNGNIKRIFPLNGKLTGYWSEDDEYCLAEEFNFNFSFAKFRQRIIGASFFENEEPKSITLWPKDKVIIQSLIGSVEVRIGFSLYADGKLESFEPYMPIKIDTPIGKITAYDRKAIGIHADSNSVRFSQDGKLQALVTTSNEVEVTDRNGVKTVYKPQLQSSQIDETAIDIIPMKIEFLNNKVRFNNREEEYNIDECKFLINIASLNIGNSCTSCSNCSSCSGCSM